MAFMDVIKYEGNNDVFVWRHPTEDFNTNSQLIVNESQEAIFYANGQALDLFGPGRHTLKSENIPFIRRVKGLVTGGETAFHCQVYYINKVEQMDILWGTDSRIPVVDPIYRIPLPIGASGNMTIKIQDSRKFIVKLVGTEQSYTQDSLTKYFRGLLMTRIKNYIATTLGESKISILDVYKHLNEFSDILKLQLQKDFETYGIELTQFFVTTIAIPEDDANYQRVNELFTNQVVKIGEADIDKTVGIKESEMMAAKRKIEGYNWQQEQAYEVAKTAAGNEGISSNMMGAGMGIGMGIPVGGVIGDITRNAINPILESSNNGDIFGNMGTPSDVSNIFGQPELISPIQQEEKENIFVCTNCGTQLKPNMKFCHECGMKISNEHSCVKCGAKLQAGEKFCHECGEPQNQ